MRASLRVAAILGCALAGGCEHAFEPYVPNDHAIFSMFGHLDLRADTQWVRVMPLRQNLLQDPAPLDAVVTLEEIGSGRVVTLRDSLFAFPDPTLGAVAYAHNFWTAERLEPSASYRLRAVRSDGASTTATVQMPPELEISYMNDLRVNGNFVRLQLRAEHYLFVDVVHEMRTLDALPADPIVVRERTTEPTAVPGTIGFALSGAPLRPPTLMDVGRQEIRIAVGRPDWPFHPGLSDLDVTLPGRTPSNVENGHGFVGGVATWTIPFHRCRMLEPRAGHPQYCTTIFNSRSASISGKVVRQPCGDPHAIANIALTERFPGGGAVVRSWTTGWDGSYRFEGIEPGAELSLSVQSSAATLTLPTLSPGERHVVDDISVAC